MYQLKIFAKSFLSLFAIMRLTGMSTKSPASVILFMVFLYIFSKLHSDRVESRILSGDSLLVLILSVIFSVSTLAARYSIILGSLTSTLFCAIILLFTGVGLFVIYYHLAIWILQATPALKLTGAGYSYAWLPYAAAALCLVCWIPYFLYEYPAVMTPDSINQYAQVIGAYELSNHHPVIHTALIGFFYKIGLSLTGDVAFGLALYTMAQMLFMAFVAGYVVRTLQKAGAITPVLVITICFYALMPYNGAYVVTMWKDIPFAAVVKDTIMQRRRMKLMILCPD